MTALTPLSPSFVRATFTGPELYRFGTDGLDQRVKLVFPLLGVPGIGISDFGFDDPRTIADGDWYARWRALPDELRNPVRTYTVRAVRPGAGQVDVDLVRHPTAPGTSAGPASRWLAQARVGDELVLIGPDAGSIHSSIGIDWQPGDARELLLAGDETAAPAICSVLEQLPADRRATAFIEVPDSRDALPIAVAPDRHRITWLPREGRPTGALLEPAVRAWLTRHPETFATGLASAPQRVNEVDVDSELLWESPGRLDGDGFYAWLAGEAGVIKSLRRLLVSETGIDRRRVAFMGYWRLGKAEAQ
ncbi:siderophore-interacting protein [Ruicaihuangia caeni]|uniref:siderophore-interacting protein n=1 Tax=Ruicaihuangia caeni TaxID=3042517 RepID=UPI00339062CD